MNRRVVGVGLFVSVMACLIVVYGVVFKPWRTKQVEEAQVAERLEANQANLVAILRWVTDNYLGYWFGTWSRQFILALTNDKIGHEFTPDQANYAERIEVFNDPEKANVIQIPASSYVLNGAAKRYPGDIVYVSSVSRKSDVILIRKSAFKDYERLGVEVLDDRNIRIALTPDSPTEDLMLLIMHQYRFTNLQPKGSWIIKANGSKDAINMLIEGKVDVAGGWEPDISRAMKARPDEFYAISTSAEFPNRLMDLIVVNTQFRTTNYEVVVAAIGHYADVVEQYAVAHSMGDQEKMNELVRMIETSPANKEDKLSANEIAAALRGIDFQTLGENLTEQFGIGSGSEQGLYECLLYWRDLYVANGMLDKNALPNVRSIVHTGVVERLKSKYRLTANLRRSFLPISPAEWDALTTAARVGYEPIMFKSGESSLDNAAQKMLREQVAPDLNTGNFKNARAQIEGFAKGTGALGMSRAQAVVDFLVKECGVDANQIRAVDKGADGVMPKRRTIDGKPESFGLWERRYSRVEIYVKSGQADNDF